MNEALIQTQSYLRRNDPREKLLARRTGWTMRYAGVLVLFMLVCSSNALADRPLVVSPGLVSPANGATNQPLTLTLTWTAESGATSYDVEVATNASFTTIVHSASVSGTSDQVGPLTNATTYYWRARSRSVIFTSDWSVTWSFTTIPAPPAVPTLASPANGATNQQTNLTLNWNTSAGAASYRVQVSTSASFSSTVINQSGISTTSYAASGLTNATTYYWRVSATNAGGSSSFSGAWSFTTAPALPPPPAAPTLSSPANGATNQPTSLTVNWNASSGATSYRLQVSTSQLFTSTLVDEPSLTNTSYQLNALSSNTTYYWRASAANAEGSSSFSGAWSFTTASALPPPPAAPTLSSPADGATNQPTNLSVTWNSSSGATSYRLQVSANPTFASTIVDDSTLTGTSYQVGALAYNTTYYWRVRAKNNGGSSAYSTAWSFTTVSAPPPPPAAPALSSPVDGATNQPTSLTVNWNVSSGATSYRLQVSANPTFASTVVDDSTLTSTTYPLSGLAYNTTYYWRASAKNGSGSGAYSNAWNFTTIPAPPPPPATPTLSSPADGTDDQPTSLTLSWNVSSGATSYRLQVSSSPSFASTLVDDSTLTNNSQQVGGLSSNTTYYWRVSAKNSGGSSAFSSTWSFTTIPTAPVAPTLSSPANGATNQPTSVTLSWSSSAGAATYRLQVSTSPSFTSTMIDDSTITATASSVNSLANNTTYYWRVSAKNAGGTSAYSAAWSFTTALPPLSAPTLSSPAEGATNQPTTLTVNWNASSGASSYRIQLSTSSSFSSTVGDYSSVAGTSQQVGPLLNGTTYYWRVRAQRTADSSAWSSVWYFTTIPAAPAAPTLSSPANGSSGVSKSPALTWNASSGAASYRLQVSLQSSFASTLKDTGGITSTSFGMSGLAEGTTYYWRVSATNAGGTSGWSGGWSFTTTTTPPPPPSTPTLSVPANGSSNRPTNLTVSWNAANGAGEYWLQVSTVSTFSSLIVDRAGLGSTSYALNTLTNGTTYYWRVRALNSGGSSGWSNAWSFSTIAAVPPSPPLLAPTDGANGIPKQTTVAWDSVSGASSYQLHVALAVSFDTLAIDRSAIPTTSFVIDSLRENKVYYWRVRATNQGGASDWSPAWSFRTTTQAPTTPALANPGNNSLDQPITLLLSWTGVPEATAYRLQVATNTLFTAPAFDDSTITTASREIGPLKTNTTYYWRVSASNDGGRSGWSNTWNFTTIPNAPVAPTLNAPADGATNQPAARTLNWNAVAGATYYRLQLSQSNSFSSLYADYDSLTTTSRQVGPLANNETYYWRVSASNSGGEGPWSDAWSFTTEPDAQNAPSAINPPNGALDQPTTLTLSWSSVSGASSYDLQVSTVSSFSTTVVSENGISGTSRQVGPLANGTTYYWRVRGNFLLITGAWSNVSSFSTIPLAPASPTLLNPPSGATDQALVVTLQWNSSPGAELYHLQVSLNAAFSSFVLNDSTLTTTSEQVGPLTNGRTYYWRIRARNTGGWSLFSTAWNFLTTTQSPSITLTATIDFPIPSPGSSYQPTDYRIVGLPGASFSLMSAILPGKQGSDWEAYWDNGAPEDYLEEYDGGSNFRFSTGRAFWLVKKGPWEINTNVPAAQLNANREVEIPLHAGWNLIANPFASSTGWAAIQTTNTVSEPLYAFNGSFAISASFDPYAGYYFYNATELTVLRVPLSSAPSGSLREASETYRSAADEWRIQAAIRTSKTTDDALWLGVAPNASAGYDRMDFHKPRGFPSQPCTYFHRPEWDSQYPSFAADIRPVATAVQTWEFTVVTPQRESVELNFNDIQNIPTEYEVYLIDSDRSRTVNLRSEGTYSFWPARDNSTLRVIVGRWEDIQAQLNSVAVPERFSLGTNYPNPFNPSTTIPFEIPERADVALKVYNLLGQEVKTLFHGSLEPGRYWYTWDGMDLLGRTVSSGMYFYMLTTNNGFSRTKKMLMTK